jgi:hypothetical protein
MNDLDANKRNAGSPPQRGRSGSDDLSRKSLTKLEIQPDVEVKYAVGDPRRKGGDNPFELKTQ